MEVQCKLEQFHLRQEDQESYEKCLYQYCVANDIAKAKNRAIHLSTCRQITYIQDDKKPCDTKETQRI